MTDSWAADEEFKSKGVKFDIVPPQILSMLQERGFEILPPSIGKEKEEAYKAWKAGDMAAADVRQSLETVLSEEQRILQAHQNLKIHERSSVAQFIVPSELS